MDIRKVSVERLQPAKYNPRKDLKPGDPEFEKLKRSVEEFGYVEPIIWNERTGVVVGGHQRLKVLMHLGYTEVDCVVLDIDEQKEKALNVALNKISGEWDMPLLTALLQDLNDGGYDATLTGFDVSEMSELFDDQSEIKEDEPPEAAPAEQEPYTRSGDIWLLGRHALMCRSLLHGLIGRSAEGIGHDAHQHLVRADGGQFKAFEAQIHGAVHTNGSCFHIFSLRS
jgi:hypothetical protein